MTDNCCLIRKVASGTTTERTHLMEGTNRGIAFDATEGNAMKESAAKGDRAQVVRTRIRRMGNKSMIVRRDSTLLSCQQRDARELMET